MYGHMMDEKPEKTDLKGCVLLDEKIVQQFHFKKKHIYG